MNDPLFVFKALNQIIKIKFPEKYKKYCEDRVSKDCICFYTIERYDKLYDEYRCIICDEIIPMTGPEFNSHVKKHLKEYNMLAFI